MQLPLEVCREFGQFAYQDEQKGIEAIAAIQGFMEEYQGDSVAGDGSQARAVTIARDQAGLVTVAKSVKLLPNVRINLRTLIRDTLGRLQETVNFSTIVVGGPLTTDSWLIDVGAVLYLMKFAADLKTVELKQEQAWVLVALHHLCGGELQLEIPLVELQAKMRDHYYFSLDVNELDNILKELRKLRCISRRKNRIYLTETVVLKDN